MIIQGYHCFCYSRLSVSRFRTAECQPYFLYGCIGCVQDLNLYSKRKRKSGLFAPGSIFFDLLFGDFLWSGVEPFPFNSIIRCFWVVVFSFVGMSYFQCRGASGGFLVSCELGLSLVTW